MRLRGVSLPVNSVIIIALAILVLVSLGYMFITGTNPFPQTVNPESAFITGCNKYFQTGNSPENIPVGDINNDGKSDNLLAACRLYFSNESMDADGCLQKCRERFPFSSIGSGSSGGGSSSSPTPSFAGKGECCDKGGDVGSEGSIECETGLWCRRISYIHSGCDKGCSKGICVKQGGVHSCFPGGSCNYNCINGWCNSDLKCE